MIIKVPQVSFNTGEISPKAYGRIDIDKYKSGLAECINCYIHTHGPVSNRSGFRFIGEAKYPTKMINLVPFIFSETQAYTLEIGDYYIRFWTQGGQIIHSIYTYGETAWATATAYVIDDVRYNGLILYTCIADHTSASTDEPGVGINWDTYWAVTATDTLERWETATAYVIGDMRQDGGSSYICLVDHTSGTFATDLAANKWVLQSIVEIASPYSELDVYNLDWTQSADTMFIVDGNRSPIKLIRAGHAQWSIEDMVFDWPPFQDQNTDSVKKFASSVTAVDASGNLTASGTDHTPFDSSWIGVHVRFASGYGIITSITSSTVAVWTVIDALTSGTATDEWALGSWSDKFGWPATIDFFEDRLGFGANENQPLVMWWSATGNYIDFALGTWKDAASGVIADDNGFIRSLLSGGRQNGIKWMIAGKHLYAGTSGGEFVIQGASDQDPISPTSFSRSMDTALGSVPIKPVMVGNSVVFVQKPGYKLIDWHYIIQKDGQEAYDRTILADHITRDYEIVDIVYQQNPFQMVWALLSNGALACLTHMSQHEVYGWHRHYTPNGQVEAMCVTPSIEVEDDELWVSTIREIDGSEVRYIEKLDPYFRSDDSLDAFFVDSGLSYEDSFSIDGITIGSTTQVDLLTGHGLSNDDRVLFKDIVGVTKTSGDVTLTMLNKSYIIKNVAANAADLYTDDVTPLDTSTFTAWESGGTLYVEASILTGLDHLEGEEVAVMVNGGIHPNRTVSGGQITLSQRAHIAAVGLHYQPYIKLLDIHDLKDPRITFGKEKRIVDIFIQMLESKGIKVGDSMDNLQWLKMDPKPIPDGFVDLITDVYSHAFDGDFVNVTEAYIVQEQPLPMTITALMSRLELEREERE